MSDDDLPKSANDNDARPKDPVIQSHRDRDGDKDLTKRMDKVLPLFLKFLEGLHSQIEIAAANHTQIDYAALAPSYRLWSDAAKESLKQHYYQFVVPLTPKERAALDEQNPHAADDFAEELMRPTEFEVIGQFLDTLVPAKSVRAGEEFYEAFEKV